MQDRAEGCDFSKLIGTFDFQKIRHLTQTQVSAVIGRGGKKEMALTGMYLELGSGHARVYGGVYMPTKNNYKVSDKRYCIIKKNSRI